MKSFSVLTVSKRTGWEKLAEQSIKWQTVQPEAWVKIREGVNAPTKTRLSNLHASFNAGLRLIDSDYVIFYDDFIELQEDCFEKLLNLADQRTFVTTCTPNYDGCFIAGTPILTPSGYKPIETIKAGDMVSTPFGEDGVISAGMTGTKPIYDFGLFKSTKKHPIITSHGVVPIDEVRYNSFIWLENPGLRIPQDKQFTFLEYLIFATLSPRTAHTDFIFNGLLMRSLEARLAYSTGKSGNIIMGQYQKAIKSITRTDTMTTRLRALSLFLQQSTQSDIFGVETKEHKRVLSELGSLLKNGIELKKADGGIQNEAELIGIIEPIMTKSVFSAIRSTLQDTLALENTVAITAEAQHLGGAEVWNLATENGLYIANNVLVGNSDDSRYTGLDAVRTCRPEEWEINVAIAPMAFLKELGGFEEELDNGWAWGNVHLAQRAAMLGAKFLLDETNRPKLLPHEMSSHQTIPPNGQFCADDIQLIRAGKKALKLSYL